MSDNTPYLRIIDDPEERKEREIEHARMIADRYGYALVERDRCHNLQAFMRTSGHMLARMDKLERERYAEHRDRRIAQHLADDLVHQGLVSFKTRDVEDKSYPFAVDQETVGTLLVVKPRITNDDNPSN